MQRDLASNLIISASDFIQHIALTTHRGAEVI